MAIKLHRCSFSWIKLDAEACWRVEKALIDMRIEYEAVHGKWRQSKRGHIVENTGQSFYPAIEFEDGTWYREESSDMAATIRAGELDSKRG